LRKFPYKEFQFKIIFAWSAWWFSSYWVMIFIMWVMIFIILMMMLHHVGDDFYHICDDFYHIHDDDSSCFCQAWPSIQIKAKKRKLHLKKRNTRLKINSLPIFPLSIYPIKKSWKLSINCNKINKQNNIFHLKNEIRP